MRSLLPLFVLCALCLSACGSRKQPATGGTDSLVIHAKSLYREYGDCDAGGGACMMVAYRWLEPGEYHHPALCDSLRAFTLGRILAPRRQGLPPAPTPEAAADALGAEYLAFVRDFPDSPAGWHLQVLCDVLRNDGQVLSVSVDEESYLGGAHGNQVQRLRSFDMERARSLRLEDIVLPGKRRKLELIAEDAFVDARGLPGESSLREAGFFTDGPGFHLTENFALLREGLWFRYNAYDVAPYALGPTDVVIPYLRLQGVLHSEYIP